MLRLKSETLLAAALCVGMAAAHANDPVTTPQGQDTSATEQVKVSDLIQQLGDDSYATRIRARERLQRMGLEAFDELHEAQFDVDNEIAMAARFLVSSLAISWSKETDPPEVRNTLIEYGAQDESERSSRIDMLSEFPDRKALSALVRLARFETSLRLSRRAALAVMQQDMAENQDSRNRNADQITAGLGDNDRQAAEWLRAYAADLASGEYSAERWQTLIDQQRLEIDLGSTQQASRPSVLELVRVTATRAADAGLTAEAMRLAVENLDLITPRSSELVDAASWAIDNNLHPFVLALQKEHQQMFSKNPMLLYSAAEAHEVAGEADQAEETAKRAAAVNPLPSTEDEREAMKLQPKDIEDKAQSHRELGLQLKDRGLFNWAEREFRHIIDALELDNEFSATARTDLAEMLADLERYQEVVDLLKPLTDRIEKDEQLRRKLNTVVMFQYNRLRSDVDYYSALVLLKEGDADKARPLLANAFKLFPRNVDILIRMYRVEGDDEWQRLVETTLDRTIRMAESTVKEAKAQAKQFGAVGKVSLGHELNQYAWLVSNTKGDYQKALSYSLQSLENQIDAAKLDTCGRCYFAVGDLEKAIITQKRAIRLSPHSPPLKRQLAEFEAAAEKAARESQ
ncbi:MAG: tetratricopeptide repeat protein [Rubripirellula sp.]